MCPLSPAHALLTPFFLKTKLERNGSFEFFVWSHSKKGEGPFRELARVWRPSSSIETGNRGVVSLEEGVGSLPRAREGVKPFELHRDDSFVSLSRETAIF